jgi:hypothetical protein
MAKWVRMLIGNMGNYQGQSTVRLLSLSFPISPFSTDGGEDLSRVIVAAFERYTVSNPLHPDVFPAIRKMEAEIVSMCLRMYNNPDGAGTMTSGGTESIVMAVKTYRDWAREVKGITEPEMWVLVLTRCEVTTDDDISGSFQQPPMPLLTKARRT